MANKYLDQGGVEHLWSKIKSYISSQVSSLNTKINGKANSSHTHTYSQITNLSSWWSSKVGTTTFSYAPNHGGTIALNDGYIGAVVQQDNLSVSIQKPAGIMVFKPNKATYTMLNISGRDVEMTTISNATIKRQPQCKSGYGTNITVTSGAPTLAFWYPTTGYSPS